MRKVGRERVENITKHGMNGNDKACSKNWSPCFW